ncbi:site-specific DNA-methyltransferase [soil metagenome]
MPSSTWTLPGVDRNQTGACAIAPTVSQRDRTCEWVMFRLKRMRFDRRKRPVTTDRDTQPAPMSLAGRLSSRTSQASDFWDFRAVSKRTGGHGFFQYPAMMVPELQGALLDDLIAVDSKVRSVYDPFMGSGTVMIESLYRGLSFHGTDINPMAVLLSYVKSSPPSGEIALAAGREVLALARLDRSDVLHDFLHRDKWFVPATVLTLSRLRRAIQQIEGIDLRRYLWVCLAETVRLASNSRESTFKLHVYSPEVLATRAHDTLRTFLQVSSTNAKRCGEHWGRFTSGSNSKGTVTKTLLRGDVPDSFVAPKGEVDVVMPSPPYGDNQTTVPYGQHSYLPLRWIDQHDLVGAFDAHLLSTPSAIDHASLGGSRRLERARGLTLKSQLPSLANFLDRIDGNESGQSKVLSFTSDYERAIHGVSSRLKVGGYSFWTLGERRVGGQEMPLVAVTAEILSNYGHSEVTTISRQLPSRKRMASKNRSGATMVTEQILVTRKTRA